MEIGSSEYFDVSLRELKGIKTYCTKQELKRLNMKHLDPSHQNKDIFAQLSGGNTICERALDIIDHTAQNMSFSNIASGTILSIHPTAAHRSVSRNCTVLEHCMVMYPCNNKDIIRFLKGKLQEIELKQCN